MGSGGRSGAAEGAIRREWTERWDGSREWARLKNRDTDREREYDTDDVVASSLSVFFFERLLRNTMY